MASAARLDLPLLSEADAPPRHRSREWRGADQACLRGVRRGGGANQRAVGVTLRNACPPPWRQLRRSLAAVSAAEETADVEGGMGRSSQKWWRGRGRRRARLRRR